MPAPIRPSFVRTTVTLDGSGSTRRRRRCADVSLDAHVAAGGQRGDAAGATADVRPTFVVDRPGTYVVQLIVNDGTVDSAPDTVDDQHDELGAGGRRRGRSDRRRSARTVTLDGSGSRDVDGDALTYRGRSRPGRPAARRRC